MGGAHAVPLPLSWCRLRSFPGPTCNRGCQVEVEPSNFIESAYMDIGVCRDKVHVGIQSQGSGVCEPMKLFNPFWPFCCPPTLLSYSHSEETFLMTCLLNRMKLAAIFIGVS